MTWIAYAVAGALLLPAAIVVAYVLVVVPCILIIDVISEHFGWER